MPFYRVPFFGSLLIEADSPSSPELRAGWWTDSMWQATHGTEIQPVAPEIKAPLSIRAPTGCQFA
jgi:hypothetical protein